MTTLETIEGIGKAWATKLKEGGINTQDELLQKGSQPDGRKEIATTCGIDEKKILDWVNRADLARVKGIGGEYADLLESAGVDTVPELAQRNATNLWEKMTEVNNEKSLVRSLPSESQVEEWITQAKDLPRAVHF
ncbi:MAG: DUF4332 domain-containing protein [Gammaproteobacteria bacterium]|nr:DUF4332 domain-containing protein [Gammaproteobacteria bacterium]